ncbi:MAG: AAA family ATPase, partial [Defluviitaleaceae bacterium]|nr:AAA family ATPase [Defluviitaleaceae bacterium]
MNNTNPVKELTWQELKYFCDAKDIDTTHSPSKELIGQERAAEALEFGLRMKEKGYNIYVCGSTGTGRTTFSLEYAKKIAETEP